MSNNDPTVPETEVKAGFQAMLEELKVNSRPHLTTLTILAGEYRQFAKQIVGLIENQLNKVRRYRLPIMYLIDSIIKEFPEDYVPIFSNNLVQLFADTFKVQIDQRTKLYDLRTTWDDVFAAEILFKLDVTVQKIDRNWPIRVRQARPREESSSDEFSSASASDEDHCKRKQKPRKHKHLHSDNVLKQSSGPNVGSTGSSIVAKHDQSTLSSTPNSVHSRSQHSNDSPKRKSRPPSNVGTSPRSSIDGRTHNRIQSLDERVSTLSESRVQSDASDTSFDNALAIDENITISSPKVDKTSRLRLFVPPGSSARFDSPSSIARRGSRGSLPGSAVSSPRNSRDNQSVTSFPLGKNRVETGVQVKCSSTTRFVQTGHFTKTAETMTEIVTKDVSTQKKLRKPKQCNFQHQFSGSKKTQATQVERRATKDSGCQWSEKDHTYAVSLEKDFAKSFEFRNAVACFMSSYGARMADSILRRLHEHQKQNQLCDLTISIGTNEQEKVRCHKYIVSMVSDVIQFESLMKDEIIFSNIKKDTLVQLIDYCYTQMIGPFVNKEHVEEICDGIRKLKIRQLDMIVDSIETGLKQGVDYCGAAISGMELISADIVTAALLGQAIPSQPLSSSGLIDLQENGLNELLPEDIDSDDEETETVEAEPIKMEEKPKPKIDLPKSKITSVPLKKRPILSHFSNDEVSGESSDDAAYSNDKAEGPYKMNGQPAARSTPTRTRKMIIEKPKLGRPRKKIVVVKHESPERKIENKQNDKSPKMPKKRKVNGITNEPSTPKFVKRARRKTDEGVETKDLSVLESISSKVSEESASDSPRLNKYTPAPVMEAEVKLEPNSSVNKIPQENENLKGKTLTVSLKAMSPKLVEEIRNSPVKDISKIVEVKNEPVTNNHVDIKHEFKDDPVEVNDQNEEQKRTRRKTVVGTEKNPSTAKTPKTLKTPLKGRRKTLQTISIKDPDFQCPWENDTEFQEIIKMRDRNESARLTGHRLMCTFVAEKLSLID